MSRGEAQDQRPTKLDLFGNYVRIMSQRIVEPDGLDVWVAANDPHNGWSRLRVTWNGVFLVDVVFGPDGVILAVSGQEMADNPHPKDSSQCRYCQTSSPPPSSPPGSDSPSG